MAGAQRWRWVGDRALLRTFDDTSVVDANRLAVVRAGELAELGAEAVEDVVVGARSVLVVLKPGSAVEDRLTGLLDADPTGGAESVAGRVVEIPVRYGGDDGPDLSDVARAAGLSDDDVVGVHSSAEYVVGFVGFSPGFAYLLGLDERIAVPRLKTPRPRVPAGSVGIGGAYTGVYPRATPGGWRLIGRTDIELFDPGRDPPALLRPGDRVRFVPR